MIKKIFSTTIIYALGPQIPKIVGFFILPFLTPYLSSSDFGVWGTIMAYVLLFSAARDLGMLAPMVNSFYQFPTKWKWVWRQIFTFLLLFGILFAVIQTIILYLVIPKEAVDNRNLIIILVIIQSLFFDVPNQIGFRLLQLQEKPIILSLISAISGFIALGVQIYCVIFLKKGYLGWFYATFFSSFFSSVCFIIIIYTNQLLPLMTYRYKFLKSRIKVSLPMLPHNYSSYLLGSSDRMVMNVYNVKTQEIGVYNVAYMWGNYVDILGNAVGMAVGPMYLKYFSEKNDVSEQRIFFFTQFLQTLFLVGTFILSLWTKELFKLFIKNTELQYAYTLSIIIIMGYSYRPLYWNVVSRLQFNYYTNQLWKISLVGGIINLVLNFIFIPIYGYQAAAITTFISLLYIGFSGFYLKAYKELDNKEYHHIKWFLLIIFSTILAFVLKDIAVLFKVIISILVLISSFIHVKKNHIPYLN
jgi:O-antigen/teichoic acid export membrane protein